MIRNLYQFLFYWFIFRRNGLGKERFLGIRQLFRRNLGHFRGRKLGIPKEFIISGIVIMRILRILRK